MSNPNQAPNYVAEIADLVNVDEHNRAHRPNGDFMKNYEAAQIEAHQDQIRDGLGGANSVAERVAKDAEVEKQAADKNAALATLSSLIEANATLDGPTLTKAGLGFEQRQKLGYGDMDSMKTDAQKLVAEKQAAKDAQAAQAVRATEAEANKARGTAQAEAWQQEVNETRAKREAANARIAELADGTAAVKDMTYKEKLENGGELGVQAIMQRSKMSQEAAAATVSAEGHDVTHLEPRYHEVTSNTAAEERARKMGELLEGLKYRAVEQKPTPVDTSDVQQAAQHLNDMPEEQRAQIWANMNAALDAQLAEQAEKKPGVFRRGLEWAKGAQAERTKAAIGFMFAGERAAGLETDDDGTVSRPQGAIKRAFGRVGERFHKTKEAAYMRASGIAPERIDGESDEQSKLGGRLAIAGAVLGVTAIALLSLRHDGGSNLPSLHEALPKGPKSPQGLDTLLNHLAESGKGTGHSVTLHAGDNPWTAAQHALGSHASTAQIDQVKDAILHNNHITEAQAHHLAVGTELKMPVELIEKINSENAS